MTKLKDVIKYMHDLIHVRLFEVYKTSDGKEKIDLIFAGSLYQIPWTYAEHELIKPNKKKDIYPIDFVDILGDMPEDTIVEDDHYKGRPGLVIYIKQA